jgi:hypothetical protein
MASGASRDAKDATGSRNRRMAYRGARSTCDGGRLKSDDVDPASLVRYSSIRGLGASLRSVEANPRVGRDGEWLVWPVYGGRGWRCRWHAVLWANTGELELGLGQGRAGVYGRGRGGFYSYRRGRGRMVGMARGYAHGLSAEGALWRCQGASNTWTCSSAPILAPV